MANEAQSIPRVVLEATKNYSSPNQIKELDLSFKDLKEYTFLPNYKNLADINISGNGLEHIPEELFKLRYIKHLNISFNLISEWDDVPMTLEKLILSNNQILDITGYVTQMSFLKYLDLSMNVVPTVNPLNRVQSLQYLFIRRNKVKFIKDLAKLKNLIEFDAEENLIEDLPEIVAFSEARSLQVLNVKDNFVCKELQRISELGRVLLPNLPFEPQVGLFCRNLEILKGSKIYELHRDDGHAIQLDEAMNALEGSLVGDSSEMKSLSKAGASRKSIIKGNTSQIGQTTVKVEEEYHTEVETRFLERKGTAISNILGDWEPKYVQDDDAASYIGQTLNRNTSKGPYETPATVYRPAQDLSIMSPARSSQEGRLKFSLINQSHRDTSSYATDQVIEETIIEEKKKTQTSSSIVRSNLLNMELSSRRSSDTKPIILEVAQPEQTLSPLVRADRTPAGYPHANLNGGGLSVPNQDTSSPMKKSFRNIPGITGRQAEQYSKERERDLMKSQRDILAIQQIAAELTQEKGNIIEKLEEAKSSRSIALKKKGDIAPPVAYPRPNFGESSQAPPVQVQQPSSKPSSKLHHQLSLKVKDADSPTKERSSTEMNRIATLTQSIVLPMEDSSPLIIPKDRKLPSRSNTFEIGLNRLPEAESPHNKIPGRHDQLQGVSATLVQSSIHKDYDEIRVQEKSYVIDSSSRPLMASPPINKAQEHQVYVSGFTSPAPNINLINQPVTVNIRGNMPNNMSTPLQASQSLHQMLPNPGQILWPNSVGGSKILQANSSLQARNDLKQEVITDHNSQFSMLKSSSAGLYRPESTAIGFGMGMGTQTTSRLAEFLLETPTKGKMRLRSFEQTLSQELNQANWNKWVRLLDILHHHQQAAGWDKAVSVDVDEMLTYLSKELTFLKTQLSEVRTHNETLSKEKEHLLRKLMQAESQAGSGQRPEGGFLASHMNTFSGYGAPKVPQRFASPHNLPRDSSARRIPTDGQFSEANKNYYFSLQTQGIQPGSGNRNFTESFTKQAAYQPYSNYGGNYANFSGRAVSNSVTESTAQNLLRRNYSSYLNPADRLNVAAMMKKGQIGITNQFSKSNAILLRPENVFMRNNSGAQRNDRVPTQESEDGVNQHTTHFIYEIHNGKHQLRRNQSIKDKSASCCQDHNHTVMDDEGNYSHVHTRLETSVTHTPHRVSGQPAKSSRSPAPEQIDDHMSRHPKEPDSAKSEAEAARGAEHPSTLTIQTDSKPVSSLAPRSGKQLSSPTGFAAPKAGVSAVFARLSNLASNPNAGKKGPQVSESAIPRSNIGSMIKSATSGYVTSGSKPQVRSTKLQSNQHLFAAMTKDVTSQRRNLGLTGLQSSSRAGEGVTHSSLLPESQS